MNRQISNQSRFTTAPGDVLPKQIRLNLCVVALVGLVLAGAGHVRAGDLHVPADYATIQAAVDAAAPGDTIHIAPGVYTEQTTIIGKDLTLIGRPGTILRAYADMELSFPDYDDWWIGVLGVRQADVTVSGLTFEGERLGDTPWDIGGNYKPWDILGILFLGAGGRVEDCRFTGFRGSTIGSNPFCTGVGVVNPVDLGTDVVDIQVLRCTFADNMNSMQFQGALKATQDPTSLRMTISVCDNTILGNGPDPTGQQRGICIWQGVSGDVQRNTITDHSWVDPAAEPPVTSLGLQAYGLLASLQPLHFEGNIFRNNQVHCALFYADDSVVVNNSFEGAAPGARPAGLGISGENVLVADNRFSDMETGIVVLGDDPDFGTSLGIASNATLVDNGFCNVDSNYNFEPLATYDLQSTLTCPEPTLDLAPAMLLSWPFAYDGYLVESAHSPEGPWSPLDATVFLQNGAHHAAVPAADAPQFFRLVKP
jgi:hypothetical protein